MIPGMVWAWISPAVNGCGGAVVVGLLLLDSVGGSPDDSGRGFVGRCCGSLSLDSVWSSWAWIPFGLALDDSGVNGCGGAVVGLLLLDSVGGSPDDSGRGFVGRCCGSLAGFCLESVAVVALSLDSVWSPWPWISPAVNGCGGGSLVCRKNHQQNERTTRQRKSNEQIIVCVGLALDDSGHGVGVDFSSWEPCGGGVAVVALSLDSVWSPWAWLPRWILFGVRGRGFRLALLSMIQA